MFTFSKRSSPSKKSNGGVTYWPRVNSLQIYFLVFLKKFALCVYMENTHNGEKRRKSEHISIYNGPTFSYILSFSTGWAGLGQKTISRYCPFKVYSGFFYCFLLLRCRWHCSVSGFDFLRHQKCKNAHLNLALKSVKFIYLCDL